jgi:integrase
LAKALLAADLPRVRVHDLRHTTASVLLEVGIHPKVVQDLLGHSTIAVTLDTYSHVAPALHREAVQRLDLLFGTQDRPVSFQPTLPLGWPAGGVR